MREGPLVGIPAAPGSRGTLSAEELASWHNCKHVLETSVELYIPNIRGRLKMWEIISGFNVVSSSV